MKFINRKKELAKLNEIWKENKAQLVAIYGKRRVGKTELIKRFIARGKGMYFLADKRAHKEQLQEFARVVGNFFDDSFVAEKGFEDWMEAFRYLRSRAKTKKFVLAIDEYPYLSDTESATSSIFQKAWDELLKDTKIYLILCGSSIAMMESELLSYKAPLYGRLTGRLLVEPMDFEASKKFFPRTKLDNFMEYYALTGGMPAYLQKFAEYKTPRKAIEALCLDKQGLYHNEVNMMLKQELRTPNIYFAILRSIAFGNTKLSHIANDTALSVQTVNKYLDTLERLQFVQREVPVTEDKPHKSRQGLYILTENFVRFWFQYVYAFSSDLEIGNYSESKKKYTREGNILRAIAYEQVARGDLFKRKKELFSMEKVGRYWDKNVEIDGVGFNTETKQIVFMEAKWSNSKVRRTVLTKLKMKAESVEWNKGDRKEYFVIYSRSGFDRGLVEVAKREGNVFLVEGLRWV